MDPSAKAERKTKRIVCLLLVLLWMGAIFAYSAMDAPDSTLQSRKVGKIFGSIVVADWEDWTPQQQEDFAAKWDHPIRKAAHMAEFAVLGALLCGTLIIWPKDKKKAVCAAILLGIAYAATDELHQIFVPGRAGRISDVGIDSIGVVIGCLLCYGVYRLVKKVECCKDRVRGDG
ncbi:MAG: VanZ family protein [Firmicutes bacterium]|nr:VanZ family protein [Bacillota bacterium]